MNYKIRGLYYILHQNSKIIFVIFLKISRIISCPLRSIFSPLAKSMTVCKDMFGFPHCLCHSKLTRASIKINIFLIFFLLWIAYDDFIVPWLSQIINCAQSSTLFKFSHVVPLTCSWHVRTQTQINFKRGKKKKHRRALLSCITFPKSQPLIMINKDD